MTRSGASFRSSAVSLLLLAALTPVSVASPAKPSPNDPTTAAELLLNHGRVDDAIAALLKHLSGETNNNAAHLLLCRAYYAEAHVDEAVAACEAAVAAQASSTAQDWMGRAYGMKANEYGPISGLAYAHKVRAAFEAAVAADAHDPAAVADLGEYYASAPSVVGGGLDKAAELADRSAAAMPQVAHRIRALASQKASDYTGAENEFRAAVGVAGRADAWMDLADFYGHRKQYDKMLDALQHGIVADKNADPSIVDAAEILISVKQHPELAEQWMKVYLAGSAQTDAAPVFKVKVSLAKLLKERGDTAGARIQLQQALALASNYAPAQKALNSL
jgi:tetratricopeptide (TPR) repeat protein